MAELIRAGKIRCFGDSNYRAWRSPRSPTLRSPRHDRPVASQPYYNAMNRMPEVEHFPACGYYGLGVVSYSPLARGVLTGDTRRRRATARERAPAATTRA